MKTQIVKPPIGRSYGLEDSKIIASELTAIQKKQGVITPVSVVTKASEPDSPLHKYFNWDDQSAADAFRLWQARKLIASVWVRATDDPKSQPVRAFVSLNLNEDDDDEPIANRGYVLTSSISTERDYQNQVLQYARDQLIGWRRRFGHYQEFFAVTKVIDKEVK